MNSIKQDFFKYITTNIIGLIGISCYILADTYFISKGTGSNGLAALNVSIPAFNLMQALGLMIGIGAATRFSLSQNKHIFTQAVYFVLICSSVFVLAGIFGTEPLARLLGANETILTLTASYLRVLLIFAPFFMMNNLLISFVRNDDKPKLAMIGMGLGSISNIILDYLFIFPLGMGMFGAALATGISPLVSMLVLSRHFLRKENTFHLYQVRLRLAPLKDISFLGISSFITEMANGIVILVFNMIIYRLSGNIGIAAYGVIANIALVVMALFTGLTQGMQPLLSREYGSGRRQNIGKIYKYGFAVCLFIASLTYLITFFFADHIIAAFNSEQSMELAAIAGIGMKLYFISIFFAGFNIMNAGFFSAVDEPKKGFLIAILRGLLLIIPVVFLLSALWGLNGVWLSLAVTDFLVLALSVKWLFHIPSFVSYR